MTALAIELTPGLEAAEPPEERGLARDGVRLLVADRADGSIVHSSFSELPRFLEAGDLVVVNTSATLPAAVPAERVNGDLLKLHVSGPAPHRTAGSEWIVELRSGGRAFGDVEIGEKLRLPERAAAYIVAPFAGRRLWRARLDLPAAVEQYLSTHGRPIRYGHTRREWPLDAYQNVYALEPGSAEMASAGRPFTAELVTRLVAKGVLVSPVVLHAGVSSQERGEPPFPERFVVPPTTARLCQAVHAWGGRVIATGTTVVRALESAVDSDGAVHACHGWTTHVVTPETGVRAVDALITGFHDAAASHLSLISAIAGGELLERSYRAALEHGYRWHEFGDSQLVLGSRF